MLDRYEILNKTGSGGFAEVFIVYDTRLQKRWAMKRIAKKGSAVLRQCFQSEIKMLTAIEHPRIPKIVDQFQDALFYYVIMDYIEGVSLANLPKGSLTLTHIMNWMLHLGEIMDYLHTLPEPILYLDLKPQNVLVDKEQRVYLIDFGNSRFYQDTHRVACGTYGYAPSEVLQGTSVSFASDIYSYGKTFAYLLQFIEKKDKRLEAMIQTCIKEDEAQRYANFQCILVRLRLIQKQKRSQFRHILYCYMVALCCFGLGFLIQRYEQSIQKAAFLQAMKTKQYEEAILHQPHLLAGYVAAYQVAFENEKRKGSMKQARIQALLYVESLMEEQGQMENREIALFYGLKCMEIDDMSFYQKAAKVFPNVEEKEALYQGYEEIAKVLGTHGELQMHQLQQLQHTLRRQITLIDNIADRQQRFHQYAVLYDLYRSRRLQFLEESYVCEEVLLKRMMNVMQTHQDLQSQKDQLIEKFENTYYEYGLWLYQNKQFATMRSVYRSAQIYRYQKKIVKDVDYRHDAMSLYDSFQYGISDDMKKKNISLLEDALRALSKIKQKEDGDVRLQQSIKELWRQWRDERDVPST